MDKYGTVTGTLTAASANVNAGVIGSVPGKGCWQLRLPASVKKQFDDAYIVAVKKYLHENVLTADIVIKRIYPIKEDYGREDAGIMVEFEPAMETLAGNDGNKTK